jgi:hypothetical protein
MGKEITAAVPFPAVKGTLNLGNPAQILISQFKTK